MDTALKNWLISSFLLKFNDRFKTAVESYVQCIFGIEFEIDGNEISLKREKAISSIKWIWAKAIDSQRDIPALNA